MPLFAFTEPAKEEEAGQVSSGVAVCTRSSCKLHLSWRLADPSRRGLVHRHDASSCIMLGGGGATDCSLFLKPQTSDSGQVFSSPDGDISLRKADATRPAPYRVAKVDGTGSGSKECACSILRIVGSNSQSWA